jgi:3-deoxy-7-phosphoheptulonate synthase
VGPLARAATAAGADGIIVEVAEEPDAALCAGPSSSTPRTSRFAAEVAGHAALLGKELA